MTVKNNRLQTINQNCYAVIVLSKTKDSIFTNVKIYEFPEIRFLPCHLSIRKMMKCHANDGTVWPIVDWPNL